MSGASAVNLAKAISHAKPSNLPYTRLHLDPEFLQKVMKPSPKWQTSIALPIAKVLGYNGKRSIAIRAADSMYAKCETLNDYGQKFYYQGNKTRIKYEQFEQKNKQTRIRFTLLNRFAATKGFQILVCYN